MILGRLSSVNIEGKQIGRSKQVSLPIMNVLPQTLRTTVFIFVNIIIVFHLITYYNPSKFRWKSIALSTSSETEYLIKIMSTWKNNETTNMVTTVRTRTSSPEGRRCNIKRNGIRNRCMLNEHSSFEIKILRRISDGQPLNLQHVYCLEPI